MTKVITRYFDNAEAARKARKELLYIKRLNRRIVHLFEAETGSADALEAAGVASATAKAYADRLAKGGAVLLVRAGHKPLSVAQTSRDVMADMGAADLGDLVEEVEYKDKVERGLNVLRDHPLMLSRPRDPEATNFYMADWPIPLINRKKPFTMAVFPPHARMANWPIPLINRRKPYTKSIFSRHARMANFPIPLISKRTPKDKFAFPRHARMADFPIPLISRRKPYTGTMIGRHTRMANWPFPHLINGKTGTNALMPGGPRMANFPIPLLSDREPYTGSAFSRHARMANFPIPLISKRTPKDKFAFPRHARMADFILPLVIKGGDRKRSGKSGGFSFSEMLGIPTLSRR
ncbi:PucR family transcriptional regulator [uncultured Tateyamaria sp.]|uniref:PucR family transcriptional regulator n=1 Tax=Tateyamaria sp. 1078 TaxID=3417464 RepID=UPI002621CB31|nr:PucR family transcriptional regulator [uncultured Tateyamaria sp.]